MAPSENQKNTLRVRLGETKKRNGSFLGFSVRKKEHRFPSTSSNHIIFYTLTDQHLRYSPNSRQSRTTTTIGTITVSDPSIDLAPITYWL
ncbi:hypothetical protein HanRHA438_Chr17g0791521 [Helianthus annuus]|nr:hypothetical protein HanRHA438_Chr17g0791521 [Helianthus annuus]